MQQGFMIFREYLDKQLTNPEFKKEFEKERNKLRIEVMINDLLQNSGITNYRAELIEDKKDY